MKNVSAEKFSVSLAAILLLLLAPTLCFAAPAAMSRDDLIKLGKTAVGYSYWWGGGCWRKDGKYKGSCSGSCPRCTHKGSYGADCSGFVGKVWQVPSPTPVTRNYHPYSTYHFTNRQTHWKRISRGSAKKGDALTYNKSGRGHIILFESGNPWGKVWAYEARGCRYGIVHNLRSVSSSYIAIRRNNLKSTPSRPRYAARWKGQHYPKTMVSGATAKVWVEYVNEGAATWDLKNTRLATTNPRDRKSPFFKPGNWLSPNRPTATDHSNYSTGKVGRFTFLIKAPQVSKKTTYVEHWGLVQEGVTWFGPCDKCVYFKITVEPKKPTCKDGDKDGYGDGCPKGKDCDDKNSKIHPGAKEVCDGRDNDCDGKKDEGLLKTFYRDEDNDKYGDGAKSKAACSRPSGYVDKKGDCDDKRANVHPGAKEICDGRDNDCDGKKDEGLLKTFYRDEDGDGRGDAKKKRSACKAPGGFVAVAGDCDDKDSSVHPGAREVCGDGKDNDCVGGDEKCSAPKCTDSDKDGYGVGSACKKTVDCDDTDPNIHPNAKEICGNGKDDDCRGGDKPCGKGKLGQSGCGDHSECETGLCAVLNGLGRCSIRCTEDKNCPSGYTCLNGAACWPRTASAGTKAPEKAKRCEKTAECENGQKCEQGFCVSSSKGCSCMTRPSEQGGGVVVIGLLLLLPLLLQRRG